MDEVTSLPPRFLKQVWQNVDAIHVDICYPRTDEMIKAAHVGLFDARHADPIRIEYDFEREGWVIKQAQVFEWEVDDEIRDPQWKEVAFVPALVLGKSPFVSEETNGQ